MYSIAKFTIFVIYVGSSLAEFTTNDCKQLGFIKSQLLCSSCEKLHDFGLDQLKPHCLECCQKDKIAAVEKKYAKAILEVCTCKFGSYPQIQAFIKSDRPSKFPNLTIKYVRGLDPMVKLLDKHGNVKETLSITKWNTDTVQEFFETVLEEPEKQDNDYLRTNEI
ncbi:selenoprotein F [Condylostylus longicornis]|uniref:selenoprotein F n=1 Tax=Condylostylus longicornis TaxID=2530218 RepID=UPI00244DAF8C|nr:selenoprotein F [Condylostylus longicornis]